jgi:hypothetical protein
MIFVPAAGKRYTALLALVLLACLGANAQTTPQLQTYSTEVTVPLAQVGAFPAPTLPANVIQAVQGGALEIRHSLVFTSSTRRLSVRTFLVAPGSPNPTPPPAQTLLHESYEVNVENILWAPQTVVPPGSTGASLVITGRIAGGSLSITGNVTNRLFVHSVGFDNVTPVRFNNLTTVVAGAYTMYATQGTGTFAYASQTPGGGDGTGGNLPPVVVATAGNNVTTAQSEIQLDASGSSDPEKGPLTFTWRFVGKTAAIINQNTAKPSVQFSEGFGEYTFEVTVTDDKGAFTRAQVKVLYVGD